jgi:hypothetical protein
MRRVLGRMELGGAGSTAAFPRMQERHRLRLRSDGRLVLVPSERVRRLGAGDRIQAIAQL